MKNLFKPKVIQKTKSITKTNPFVYVSLEEQIQELWKSHGYTHIIEKFHTEDDKHIWTITCKKKP